jgi:autotransporter passenger strand-loop-strand repeat protein
VISAGGSDTVFGLDTGATVNSGGSEIVSGGGTVSSATVNSAGLLIMEGGRSWLSGASINSGGTLVLSGGFGPEFFSNVVNNGTIDFECRASTGTRPAHRRRWSVLLFGLEPFFCPALHR